MASPLCPLNPQAFILTALQPMGLLHLKEIEEHICAGNCINGPHPSLKDITFQGPDGEPLFTTDAGSTYRAPR